jgi:hypothetical protein
VLAIAASSVVVTSCHDDPTAPQMNLTAIDDGPRRVDDPTFGWQNSSDAGTYDGIIEPV